MRDCVADVRPWGKGGLCAYAWRRPGGGGPEADHGQDGRRERRSGQDDASSEREGRGGWIRVGALTRWKECRASEVRNAGRIGGLRRRGKIYTGRAGKLSWLAGDARTPVMERLQPPPAGRAPGPRGLASGPPQDLVSVHAQLGGDKPDRYPSCWDGGMLQPCGWLLHLTAVLHLCT